MTIDTMRPAQLRGLRPNAKLPGWPRAAMHSDFYDLLSYGNDQHRQCY